MQIYFMNMAGPAYLSYMFFCHLCICDFCTVELLLRACLRMDIGYFLLWVYHFNIMHVYSQCTYR